jgi:transcriptional antiterminator RfaH
MTRDTIAGWYVLITRQHAEKRVRDELEHLKITSYLPLERHLRRHARQTKAVEKALIPRYLFVQLDSDSDYHTVRTTDGVVDFLRHQNRKPAQIPELKVLELHLMEALGDFDCTPTQRSLDKGPVRIVSGQFQGQNATLVEHRENYRALVTTWLFGRESRPFEIDARMLEAA